MYVLLNFLKTHAAKYLALIILGVLTDNHPTWYLPLSSTHFEVRGTMACGSEVP